MVGFEAAKDAFERRQKMQAGCLSKEKQQVSRVNASALKGNAKDTSSGKLIKTGCLQR